MLSGRMSRSGGKGHSPRKPRVQARRENYCKQSTKECRQIMHGTGQDKHMLRNCAVVCSLPVPCYLSVKAERLAEMYQKNLYLRLKQQRWTVSYCTTLHKPHYVLLE